MKAYVATTANTQRSVQKFEGWKQTVGSRAIVAVSVTAVAHPAAGQAFIPAAGDGTVSVSYQAASHAGKWTVRVL